MGIALSATARGLGILLVAAAAALLCGSAEARLLESQAAVPVEVFDAYRKAVSHPFTVTVFVDDATPAPRPVVVLNHGRATDAAGRAAVGRSRYLDAARWFAGLGFAVAVPTRVGYGVTGGVDIEDSGSCANKNYPPGYAAAAAQTMAVLRFMHDRPDTRSDRDVVVGQSYGGTTSIALAALNPAGLVAVVNFAGGGGGNPKERPQSPCGPTRLERLFAGYGQTARVPSLWIYSLNDQYFGPAYPAEWFKAFEGAGGTGRFFQVPPQGEDGHLTFTRAPAVWRPIVLAFLGEQGFAVKE